MSQQDVIHVQDLYINQRCNLPSYTTTQRDALSGMQAGTVIFNSSTGKLNFYTGSVWEAITSAE